MRRIFSAVLLCIISSAVSAESSLTSILDENGSFLNRLRLQHEESVISLTSELSDVFFVEPTLKSNQVLIGRLKLKGLLRELYNPDNSSAGATVLSENGSLTVTDSFIRGSRYGAVLLPGIVIPASCWLFKSNNGSLSAGFAVQELEPPELPSFIKLAADFSLIAGTTVFNNPTLWFDYKPLIPVQAFANPALELRFYAGDRPGSEIDSGRKMMKVQKTPAVSISVLAALSLPVYTCPGWLMRIVGCGGSEILNFTGNFQINDESFIAPNGELTDNHLIAGIKAGSSFTLSACDLSFGFDFTHTQKRIRVVPGRYIACQNEIKSDADINIDESGFKLNAGWRQDFDCSGACFEDFDLGIGCKIILGQFVLSSDYKYSVNTENGYCEEIEHEAGGKIVFSNEVLKISLEGLCRKVNLLKTDLDITLDTLDISMSAEIGENMKPEFSIGFITFW